jgi:hypothetical protein
MPPRSRRTLTKVTRSELFCNRHVVGGLGVEILGVLYIRGESSRCLRSLRHDGVRVVRDAATAGATGLSFPDLPPETTSCAYTFQGSGLEFETACLCNMYLLISYHNAYSSSNIAFRESSSLGSHTDSLFHSAAVRSKQDVESWISLA